MDHLAALLKIMANDAQICSILGYVRSLGLPDCWVGAGLVRNAVWRSLHGRAPARLSGDVDVVWFSAEPFWPATDQLLEVQLLRLNATINWSVKNQARRHTRNRDPAYESTEDAMRHWPETATAVAVRLTPANALEVAAPFGLGDLFDLVLRPTPAFTRERYPTFVRRVREKAWLTTWPLLRVEESAASRIVTSPWRS